MLPPRTRMQLLRKGVTGLRGARLSGLVPSGRHGMQLSGACVLCGGVAGPLSCARAEDGAALLMLQRHVCLWAGRVGRGGWGGGRAAKAARPPEAGWRADEWGRGAKACPATDEWGRVRAGPPSKAAMRAAPLASGCGTVAATPKGHAMAVAIAMWP